MAFVNLFLNKLTFWQKKTTCIPVSVNCILFLKNVDNFEFQANFPIKTTQYL